MTLHRSALFLFAVAAAVPVAAAPFTVTVKGADGAPLRGAVVTVTMPGVPPPPIRGPYLVEQRNIAFQPHLLIVPVGAAVGFPNRDTVRHHVYSFSKAKKFDLKLYGREDQRSVVFDKPGVVALGCNIHDAMSGFVFVTATPFTAQTDGNGRVAFNLPVGHAIVQAWDPSIRAAGNVVAQPVAIVAAGGAAVLSARR